jgi:glucose/arabinose dehydrogenase
MAKGTVTPNGLAILGGVRARAPLYAVPTLVAALAALGCAGNGSEGEAKATESAASTDTRPQAMPSVRGVRLKLLGRFSNPTYLTAPRGDRHRRFVVERGGTIRVVRDGHKLKTPFLNISSDVRTDGEAGLLSMAFAPDYSKSRLFYVYYVANNGWPRIEELKRSASSADRADKGSRRLVITQQHHRFNHKGGQLQFGPDGMLYTGFGDGGGGGDPDRAAQNRGVLPGKLLRIDPRRRSRGRGYAIPSDNPFRGRSGIRPEIYAYGLRNPFRFSFDRTKGSLTVGDVGQDEVEEVDFVKNRRGKGKAPRGGYNFGWSVFEGRSRYRDGTAPGHIGPVTQRTHEQGFCSMIGGYVIRDRTLGRRFYGKYVYGDLCDPKLRIAALSPGRVKSDRTLGPKVSQLDSFGEDGVGRVYAVSLDGPVYRLAPR